MRIGLTQKIETRERLAQDNMGMTKLNLTGKDTLYAIIAEEYGTRGSHIYGWFSEPEMIWRTTLQEVILVHKPSKEEIAAEESVAKAKEALQAAENALKCVKEKK